MDFLSKTALHIFFLLCTKRANFVGNLTSLPSIESSCSLLSIGTFRFTTLRQLLLPKFSNNSLEIDNEFLQFLGYYGCMSDLYVRNCEKCKCSIFYACHTTGLVFFHIESESFHVMNENSYWVIYI